MDLNERYLKGVSDLLWAMQTTDDDYLSVLTLQGRLAQAVADTQQYGSTETTRHEIAHVTMQLDRLCETFG
ncbi:MAG: hypothetical protein JXA33_17460 [Anaerolineae bacterium]|nr:hypothetical protein [Anaerolineae bacterium]